MSWGSMADELRGVIPRLPFDYACTLIQRAWGDVRRKSLWSFLLFEANWTSPSLINAGSAAVTQGANTVTLNGVALAALLADPLLLISPITNRQFRVGIGTIYNIWALDQASGILTLDRAYQETSNATSTYQIYQCYYPAPMADFWHWISVRDIINYNDLITTKTRAWVDERDPQRSIYYIPTHVIPYQTDLNPASPTYGFQLFELWGQPNFNITYQLYGLRKGVDFASLDSVLPVQIGEDCLIELGKQRAYEWAESNKDNSRMMGSDYRFLMGQAQKEYQRLYREYRLQDFGAVNNFAVKLRRGWSFPNLEGWFSSVAGYASPGAPW